LYVLMLNFLEGGQKSEDSDLNFSKYSPSFSPLF
jgi:hypothetical protein